MSRPSNAPDQKRAKILAYELSPAPGFCIWMLGSAEMLVKLITSRARSGTRHATSIALGYPALGRTLVLLPNQRTGRVAR